MNTYLRSVVSDADAVPGSSIAVQTYGDFLNFNPHLHAVTTDGCFPDDDSFKVAPGFIFEDLEEIFQSEVLKMFKSSPKKIICSINFSGLSQQANTLKNLKNAFF